MNNNDEFSEEDMVGIYADSVLPNIGDDADYENDPDYLDHSLYTCGNYKCRMSCDKCDELMNTFHPQTYQLLKFLEEGSSNEDYGKKSLIVIERRLSVRKRNLLDLLCSMPKNAKASKREMIYTELKMLEGSSIGIHHYKEALLSKVREYNSGDLLSIYEKGTSALKDLGIQVGTIYKNPGKFE